MVTMNGCSVTDNDLLAIVDILDGLAKKHSSSTLGLSLSLSGCSGLTDAGAKQVAEAKEKAGCQILSDEESFTQGGSLTIEGLRALKIDAESLAAAETERLRLRREKRAAKGKATDGETTEEEL